MPRPPARRLDHLRHLLIIASTVVAVATAGQGAATAAATSPCTIIAGSSIGAIRIGMSLGDALAVAGPATSQRAVNRHTLIGLRPPWSSILVERQLVIGIETRSPACRTTGGVGVGVAERIARAAYASAIASMTTSVGDADRIEYPFDGIALLVRRQRVVAVEVFEADRAPGRAPASGTPASERPAPTPSPARAAAWVLKSMTARVDDTVLLVTGSVDNNTRAQAVFAEVRAFGVRGQLVAQGDAPVDPTPLPSGRTGRFEARVTIDDVVRRIAVIVRPTGSVTGVLVEGAVEITDVRGFAPIVARSLSALVQTTAQPPTRDSLLIAVSNGSPLVVGSVTVAVEVTVTCRIVAPTPRAIQEIRTGTATVLQLRPGEIGRAPLSLSAGICTEFATWTSVVRIGEVRVAE